MLLLNFDEWTGKHPIGKLLSTIGTVDEIFNFFEYQLYCMFTNFN